MVVVIVRDMASSSHRGVFNITKIEDDNSARSGSLQAKIVLPTTSSLSHGFGTESQRIDCRRFLTSLHSRRDVIHADETPVQQLDPGKGKTRRAYLWARRPPICK
jgi:hypothetical protein